MIKPKYYKKDDPNMKISTNDSTIVKAYMPPMLHARLRDQSRLLGLPMSRLIAIAIDNELDQECPFAYDTSLPESDEEYNYVSEITTILDYICRYPKGIGRDHLCLARHDFGIESRSTVLGVVKQLLEKGMVEEIMPRGTMFKFWHSSYRLLRAKDIHYNERKPKKFKRIEGESTKYTRRVKDKGAL